MKLKTELAFFVLLFFSQIAPAQNKSFTTHLPIVYLNTNGQTIPDDPKINATMEIAWHENGTDNSTSDPRNHFKGKIQIEVRGSSSQMSPKKSYGFELKDADGADMDFPLLGMPTEEDWILYAPYSDKSLMRNVLTFTLADKMSDNYAPRCRFAELFLNNEYQGVYVLMEKIKRGPDRVDINKLKADELSGADLTGGYIIKIDKQTGDGGDGWWSQFTNSNYSRTFYQYDYPESDDIQPEQKNYIQQYVNDFETAISNLWRDNNKGYQNYMNVETFYDYVIVNELSKNVDGYRLSAFMNKDKDGKLNAGPFWDYNLAFGNAYYYDGWTTYGLFVFQDIGDDYWQVPFWWKKLMSDATFTNPMRCRWDGLREDILSEENILGVIDSITTLLGSSIDRNFSRWPILSQYVWPNYYIGNTYQNEIYWLKDWISTRLGRVDNELPGTCDINSLVQDISEEWSMTFYPNPFTNELNLEIVTQSNDECILRLYNLNGALLQETKLPVIDGANRFNFAFPKLNSGVYFYRMIQGDHEFSTGKLVKR